MTAQDAIRHWSAPQAQAVQASSCAAEIPWHAHEHHILCLVERGLRTVVTSFGALEVEAGCGFVIPAFTAHRCLLEERAAYRALSLKPSICEQLKLRCGKVGSGEWNRLFLQAFEEVVAGAGGSLVPLLELTGRLVGEAQVKFSAAPHHIQKIDCELQENLSVRKTLCDLARRLGLSPCYIQHIYSRAKGLSPLRQRLLLQLRQARRMLVSGVSLSELSLACGFADQSHFTRAFRRLMGVSPGRYRSQLLAESRISSSRIAPKAYICGAKKRRSGR